MDGKGDDEDSAVGEDENEDGGGVVVGDVFGGVFELLPMAFVYDPTPGTDDFGEAGGGDENGVDDWSTCFFAAPEPNEPKLPDPNLDGNDDEESDGGFDNESDGVEGDAFAFFPIAFMYDPIPGAADFGEAEGGGDNDENDD